MLTYTLFKTKHMPPLARSRKATQMLTYTLFKTQNMLPSAAIRKSHPDADLHAVQNPEHASVSNKQEVPASF
jgi:hypothetical protein